MLQGTDAADPPVERRQQAERGPDRLLHQEIRQDGPPIPHHRDTGRNGRPVPPPILSQTTSAKPSKPSRAPAEVRTSLSQLGSGPFLLSTVVYHLVAMRTVVLRIRRQQKELRPVQLSVHSRPYDMRRALVSLWLNSESCHRAPPRCHRKSLTSATGAPLVGATSTLAPRAVTFASTRPLEWGSKPVSNCGRSPDLVPRRTEPIAHRPIVGARLNREVLGLRRLPP
jgi:hypothetical protein